MFPCDTLLTGSYIRLTLTLVCAIDSILIDVRSDSWRVVNIPVIRHKYTGDVEKNAGNTRLEIKLTGSLVVCVL